MLPRIIDHAVAAAGRGYRVHPLQPGSKLPILKAWQTEATNDPERAAEMFRRYPDANLGIATGGNVCVIDVDVKAGTNGFFSLEALAAKGKELPPAPVSVTPSGGHHLWFQNAPGLRNCAGMTRSGRGLGVGVDFRGEGGFIVAPPSRIKGVADYYWLVTPKEVEPPPLPEWAVAMLRPREVIRPTIQFRKAGYDPGNNLDRIANFVARCPSGQRNPTLYWAVCEALRAGCSPQEVETKMLQACEVNGLIAADGLAACMATIRSGMNAEKVNATP